MPSLSPAGALTLLCVACLTIMVGCVIVPGLPGVSAGLSLSADPTWLVTLPSLGVVLFAPAAGWIITRQGARRALRLGLLAYGGLGIVCVALGQAWLVYADRLALGGATALVMVAGTALISDFYSGEARLRMIARQGMAIELGGVVFLALGGLLAQLGWQWPFILYLTAWLLLALSEIFLPAVPQASAPALPASAPRRTPGIMPVHLCAFLSMTVFFTAIVNLPSRLQGIGLSESATGYLLSFVSLVAVGAAAAMPLLTGRFGALRVLALSFAAYVGGHLLFLFSSRLSDFVAGAILLGCGFGFSLPLANHLAVERSPAAQRGRNLAHLSMAIFLGQFLSSALTSLAAPLGGPFAAAAMVGLAGGIAAFTTLSPASRR